MNGVLLFAAGNAIGAILMGVVMAIHPWRRPTGPADSRRITVPVSGRPPP
jgi:hypothetical protein